MTTPATAEGRALHGKVGDLYWHVHHRQLAEFLTKPIENRIAYIKSDKPKREVPIRLKWMTPVLGEVPAALAKARDAYDKAWDAYAKARDAYAKARDACAKARDAYDKAWDAYDKARDAYDKAWDAYVEAEVAYAKALDAALPALEALHATEHPGCPWNGKTIFPDEQP